MARQQRTASIRDRLRRFAPPGGAQYELFDCSLLLGVFAVFFYLAVPVGQVSLETVAFQIDDSKNLWGGVLAVTALLGAATSYSTRAARLGYAVIVVACGFWSASFILGVLFLDTPIQGVALAAAYGWIASRLVRETVRAGRRECL